MLVDVYGLAELILQLLGLSVFVAGLAQEALTHYSHCLEVHLCSIESEKVVQKIPVCIDLLHQHISFMFLFLHCHVPSFVEVFVHFSQKGGIDLCFHHFYKEVQVGEDNRDNAVSLGIFLEKVFELGFDLFLDFFAHVTAE